MSGSSRRTRDRSQRWLLLAALVVLPGLVLWRWIASVGPEVDVHRDPIASSVDSSRPDPVAADLERPVELEPASNALADAHRDVVDEVEPAVADAITPSVFGSIVGTLRAADGNVAVVVGKRISCTLLQVRGPMPPGYYHNRRYEPNQFALTSARGEFTIADLAPGEWDLGCEVTGYRPARLHCVVETNGAASRVDLTLEPLHQISIYLTDDSGEPIVDRSERAGAEALNQLAPWACAREPVDRSSPCAGVGMIPMKSRTTGTGDPRIWRVVEVDSYEPMWIGIAIGECVLDGQPVTGHERELHLHVGDRALKAILGKLSVQVNDANGIGISGAQVIFGAGGPRVRRATTDASGRVEMVGLPPVRTAVQFTHLEYLPTWKPMELACGGEATLAVSMQSPIVVRGRLIDARGVPKRGSICAIRTPTEPGMGHDLVVVSADDSGRFEFPALAPDVHMLMDKRRLDQRGGSTREVDADTPGAVRVDGRLGNVFGVTVIAGSD